MISEVYKSNALGCRDMERDMFLSRQLFQTGFTSLQASRYLLSIYEQIQIWNHILLPEKYDKLHSLENMLTSLS